MNKRLKFIFGIIMGLLLGGITVFAATRITAQEVPYTNNKLSGVTNVGGAIDELYTKAENLNCPIGYNCSPKYYVSYDACSGSGAPSNTEHTYGVASNISSTTPTRSNYTFQGWSKTSCSGSVDLASGASISDLSSTPGATVSLYAIWKSKTTTCEYTCKGGFIATYTNGKMTSCRYSGERGSAVCDGGYYSYLGGLYSCQQDWGGGGACNACSTKLGTQNTCGWTYGGCPSTYTCP